MNGMTETMLRESAISFPFLGLTVDPPASFTLFGREIYFYGVIIALAFGAGIWYCTRKCARAGLTEDDVYDVILWLIPAGIIGARLYFVLFRIDYYIARPGEIFALHEGGLAIYGGIIAGVIAAALTARHKKVPPLAVLDLLITACALGQAIGRWGNFMNREAFGRETEIFCRMGLTTGAGETVYVHPTFLYESLWDLAVFLVLNRVISKKYRYSGQCILLYCLLYGTGRALIEGLRTDSLYIPGTGIRVSQLLSACLAAFGAVMLIVNRKKAVRAGADGVSADCDGTAADADCNDAAADTDRNDADTDTDGGKK